MGAEDEFRKVAEDVRELARSLRHELKGAQWEAKSAARQARDEIRSELRAYRRGGRSGQNNWSRGYQRYDYSGRARGGTDTQQPPAPPVWRPPAPPKVPKPPKPKPPPLRHRKDGSTLVSLLLVVIGLAWLASQTKVFTISVETVLAVALAILGAGMVVTARTDWSLSRRGWPVWLGALLIVLLIGASSNLTLDQGLGNITFGPKKFAPRSWDLAKGTIENTAGAVTVDLTGLAPAPPGAESQTLIVREAAGTIDVNLPVAPPNHIHVVAHTRVGSVNLPTGSADNTADYGPTSSPILTLDLHDTAGDITVHQANP